MSEWTIRSAELRRRRLEMMLSQVELWKLSSVSLRTIRKLEAGDVGVSSTSLDLLARALKCERTDIATWDPNELPEETVLLRPPPPATNGDTSKQPKMIDLRAIEVKLPAAEDIIIDGVRIPKLTVLRYQRCFTAYLARDGERYWVEGRVTNERGLPPAEAKLVGGVSGEAGRFEIRCDVGTDGHELVVTVHTQTGALTIALQHAAEERAMGCIVRLVALRDVPPGAGFASFARERPSPWGLVVERIIEIPASTRPDAKPARKARGAKRVRA